MAQRGKDSSYMPAPTGARRPSSLVKYKYFRRLLKFKQMDFEYALWQMWFLVVNPNRVYKTALYEKSHKNQYARDDPAFVVLLAGFLFVSSVVYALVFKLSFSAFIMFMLWVVCVDCIGTGCVVATILWWISNNYLRTKQPFAVEESVEWGYAFDVHCNAFFPLLLILHVLQLLLLGIINHDWFFSVLLADTLWLVALCYYIYITFLGYSALPFLNKSTVVLYLIPVILVFCVYVIAVMLRWNVSRTVFSAYYGLLIDFE